jgi:hypothetical protein
MTTDKIISIARKLDQQGKFATADKVFSQLIKTAQEKPLFGSEREPLVQLPGRTGLEQNSLMRTQEFFAAQDAANALHLSLNRINSLSNGIARALRRTSFTGSGGSSFTVFTITPLLRTKLMEYWDKVQRLQRILKKSQIGEFKNPSKQTIIDDLTERMLNLNIEDFNNFVSANGDILNSLRNMLRSSESAQIQQNILPAIAVAEVFLQAALVLKDIDPELKEKVKNTEALQSKPIPLSQSQIPVAGWEMPKEFKVVKLPDAAPSIFGGTVAGSKAEIDRQYDKLSKMDDKNFADSYQLLREEIQSAFNSNESKFSKLEQDEFANKMQTLKSRYYDILYRDKPKSSFTD